MVSQQTVRQLSDQPHRSQGNTPGLGLPSVDEIPLPQAWAILLGIPKPCESARELEKRASEVKRRLTDAEPRVFSTSVACLVCREEFAALPASGVCTGCEGADERNDLIGRRLEKILGTWSKGRFTLENFQAKTEEHQNAKKVAIAFRPATESLYLQGPCGSGKTHLAAALLQEWAAFMRGSVAFERTTHLMRMLRGLKGSEESAIIENLASKRLLVIDDLGVGRGTEYTLSVLYEIIEERTHKGLHGLIVTSNLGLDDLSKKFGDDRLTSRIAGMCRVVYLDLPDWRSYQR